MEWHFWIASMAPPDEIVNNQIICVRMGDNTMDGIKSQDPNRAFHITTRKNLVDCLACLDWIHA